MKMKEMRGYLGSSERKLGHEEKKRITLLLEVVVALEARAETINGLAGLANPESDGVYGFAQGPHISAFSVTERFEQNSLGFGAYIRLRFQLCACV